MRWRGGHECRRQFGRARPATGFSLDLRDLVRVLPQRSPAMGIRVAGADAGRAREAIAAWRRWRVLVIDYLGRIRRQR